MTPTPEFLAVAAALKDRQPEGPRALEALAKRNDPHALLTLGECLVTGLDFPKNPAKGFKMIEKAAALGEEQARRTAIYLTNRGIGRKANPALARNMLARLAKDDRFAAVQLGLLDHLECAAAAARVTPEIVSADPYIAVYRGFFNKAEYTYLRHIGTPHMRPAMIAAGTSGGGVLDPVRRSDTTAIPLIEQDLIVHAIVSAIAEATGTDVDQGEPLALLRYGPGQEYRPHYDAYEEGWPGAQRQMTALVWLNDEYQGGETHFPRLGITVRGAPGDMLVFANLDANGNRDDRMEHAGLPVTRGEKWLASRWISVANQA